MEKLKHILLCVAGGTPAIITETLWALMDKGERVDEVRVITTITEPEAKFKTGRERILEDLLAEPDGQFHRFRRDFPEFARDLPLDKKIRFDKDCLYLLTNKETGVPSPRDDDRVRLTDILDDRDNQHAANQICDIVRELTREEQNARLHASVAGGRKTMGLYLLGAMQLFGRAHDAMSHVLVNPAVENRAADFYYKTPQPKILHDRAGHVLKRDDGNDLTTEDGEIYLADIPFIRLSKIIQERFEVGSRSYGEIVEKAQTDLAFLESGYDLRFDVRKNLIKIGAREAKLTPKEFFIYLLFAYFRKQGAGKNGDGFVAYEKVNREDLDAVCRLISKAKGRETGFEGCDDFVANLDFETVRRELRFRKSEKMRKALKREPTEDETSVGIMETKAEIRNKFEPAKSRIDTALREAEFPSKYFITTKVGATEHLYGFTIPPERIQLP